MELVSEYLSIGLTTLIQFIIAIGGIIAIRVIMKLFEKLGIEVDNQILDGIEDTVFKAVNVTNQTVADIWRAANQNNSLTKEQQELAFENTKSIIMASLSTKQLEALANKFGIDAEEAVELLIENTVYWNSNTGKFVTEGVTDTNTNSD